MIGTLILIFILGAIIGSFLNVLIYRYPIMLEHEWDRQCAEQLHQAPPASSAKKLNLCVPRSHCPHCKNQIAGWCNIPILSYIFLRGKCMHCHTSISPQYFIVEIISAILPVLVVMHFGLIPATYAIILLTWGLIALSFIDFNHQFLPDTITYILLWLGLIISTQYILITSEQAIIGAIIGYLFLWIVGKVYLLLRKQEGMGLGDCKMFAMIGAWVGAVSLLYVLLISTLLGLMISLILLLFKKINKSKPISFGPFIAIGGWCVIVYGNQITLWITKCLS